RVHLAVLTPFSDMEHDIGALTGLLRLWRIVQERECLTSIVDRNWVVHPDDSALGMDGCGYGEGRRVADVVTAGLERSAQHSDLSPVQRAADQLACQRHGACATTRVQLIHLMQESQRFGHSELLGAGYQPTNVFR